MNKRRRAVWAVGVAFSLIIALYFTKNLVQRKDNLVVNGETNGNKRLILIVACLSWMLTLISGYCFIRTGQQERRLKYAAVPSRDLNGVELPSQFVEDGVWLGERRTARRNSDAARLVGDSVEERIKFIRDAVVNNCVNERLDTIADSILSTDDPQLLVEMKWILDNELRQLGSSLYGLLYELFPKGERRDAVLKHITSTSKRVEIHDRPVLILSDMDDTLVSTFKDMRFPFNTIYPGIRQFYHELVRKNQRHLINWTDVKERISFVTARPSFLNFWTQSDLKKHGFETSIALTGSSTSFMTPASMLSRKIMQCKRLLALFPEVYMYLVGDNGQRDIDLGKELIAQNLVQSVFIHDIFDPLSHGEPVRMDETGENSILHQYMEMARRLSEQNPDLAYELAGNDGAIGGSVEDSDDKDGDNGEQGVECTIDIVEGKDDLMNRDAKSIRVMQSVPRGHRNSECADHGIILFQTYSGAAVEALQRGLLDLDAVIEVALASAKDFTKIAFKSPEQRRKQQELFLRDVGRISPYFENNEDKGAIFFRNIHETLNVDPRR